MWAFRVVGVALLVALGTFGCSSSAESPTGRSVRNINGGAPNAGDGGGDSPAPLAPGDFGNSSEPAPVAPMPTGDPIDDCPPGERCFANEPDPTDCGTVRLESEVEVIEKPGNVLLVFDRSGSMRDDWSGQARWQVAGKAITEALMPIANNLTVGSVFFPSPDAPTMTTMGTCVDPTGITCIFLPDLTVENLGIGAGTCGVSPITGSDQIPFAPGIDFLVSLTNTMPPLYAPVDGGRTPLLEGLQQAQGALAAATLDGVTSVVIITDGRPNCQWQEQSARQIVADWLTQEIRTYVIGLPGADGADQVLNGLAAAGGTDTYIPASDPALLQSRLREIAQETVKAGLSSCDVTLDPPAEVPEKLRMVVLTNGEEREVPRKLSDNAGWSITTDGSQVTIEGALCDEAKAGAYEEVRFEFSCKEIPPLPVPAVK